MLVAEKQLSDPTQRIHKVLETARILYGLIHARYVLTAQGLTDMARRPILNLATVHALKAHDSSAVWGEAASCRRGSPRRALPLPLVRRPEDAVRISPAQKAKYKAHEFGSCPRTLCEKQTVLPTGVSDTASLR